MLFIFSLPTSLRRGSHCRTTCYLGFKIPDRKLIYLARRIRKIAPAGLIAWGKGVRRRESSRKRLPIPVYEFMQGSVQPLNNAFIRRTQPKWQRHRDPNWNLNNCPQKTQTDLMELI